MQKLARALNIEQGEGVLISLILIQSFFIGTFMSTFDVAANALFFTSYTGDDLGQAYAFSAVVGMLFTFIYIKLQSWISFSKLAIINLSFIAVLSVLMRLGFEYSESKELIYAVFLLQGPLNTLAIVGFWGLMGRIFNLRQGKRLFGLVDSGQILGMIIICFSGPIIQRFMPDTKDLIIISATGIVLSVVMQVILSSKYNKQIEGIEDEVSNKVDEGEKEKSSTISIFQMLKSPYISMMVFFVMLAMLSQFFVHYSFLVTAKAKYPTDVEFAEFFFLFTGTVMIFTFVFKTFVFGKLMQMYGLKVNLLILPFLLVFFTVVACISGTFFGYEETSSGFLMFFMFIAISKLFAQSLRGAIEVPAFKLLYQPLDQSIKYDVQAKIDGTVNEFSALIGGLVLMGLSLISFVTLISYSYVLVLIMAAYIFITFKLYSKYQDTLRETLNSFKSKVIGDNINLSLSQILKNLFSNKTENQALSVLKVCEKVKPIVFEKSIKEALDSKGELLAGFAHEKVKKLGLSQYKSAVENSSYEYKQSVLEVIDKKGITKDIKTISRYLRSKNPVDKILLLNQVAADVKPNISVIGELLKDPNSKVKKAAILTVGKIKDITLVPTIIDYINDSQYRTVVSEVLLGFGKDMFELLDLAFYKSNFESQTLVQIVSIFRQSKDKEAIPYLLKKINYPDQKVVNTSFEALMDFEFKPNTSEAVKVQQSIEQEIGVALWNIVALEEAKEYELPDFMIDSLLQEKEDSIDHIYTLLSLLYDQQSIANIRQNIETGSAEGIGFAIELLDLFVVEELKPKLFPIFDDLDLDELIYRLELFYPVERLNKKELLIQIINRDFNFLNNWTKACALYTLILEEDKGDVIDDYVAQMFNMDPLIYQNAAWLIYQINKQTYFDILPRIYAEKRVFLEEFIQNKESGKDSLMFEKAMFFVSNNWLKGIKGKLLSQICSGLITVKINPNEELNNVLESFPLAIVKEGQLNFGGTDVNEGEILSDLVLTTKEVVKATKNTELYVIESGKFYDLLYLHQNFLNMILDLIGAYHNQKEIIR